MEEGHRALGVMEEDMKKHRFFVDDRLGPSPTSRFMPIRISPTSATSISAPFPYVHAWLDRVGRQLRSHHNGLAAGGSCRGGGMTGRALFAGGFSQPRSPR